MSTMIWAVLAVLALPVVLLVVAFFMAFGGPCAPSKRAERPAADATNDGPWTGSEGGPELKD